MTFVHLEDIIKFLIKNNHRKSIKRNKHGKKQKLSN